MAVVADTSPIDYLVLIAQIDLLNQLYARILIPPAKKKPRCISNASGRCCWARDKCAVFFSAEAVHGTAPCMTMRTVLNAWLIELPVIEFRFSEGSLLTASHS